MKDIALPSPLVRHLVVVGGDVISEHDAAWKRAWTLMHNRMKVPGRDGLLLGGPLKGSPDALGAYVARENKMLRVKLDFNGYVIGNAVPKADLQRPDGYTDLKLDRWTEDRTCDEVMMDVLAMQAHLALRDGWRVSVIIFHGWNASYRGELLSERMKHLGVQTTEFDIATNGALSNRDSIAL